MPKQYTPGAIGRDFSRATRKALDLIGNAVKRDLQDEVPVDSGDLKRGVGFRRTGDFRGVVSTGKGERYAGLQNQVNPTRKGFGGRVADNVGSHVAAAFRAAFRSRR
jgi:hypothetical protein